MSGERRLFLLKLLEESVQSIKLPVIGTGNIRKIHQIRAGRSREVGYWALRLQTEYESVCQCQLRPAAGIIELIPSTVPLRVRVGSRASTRPAPTGI